LNYGLIMPYLAAGIAVIHGWRIRPLCIAGVLGIVVLGLVLNQSGVLL